MPKERRYWDSNAFLGWLNDESGRAGKCRGTIEAAERGEIEIITSTLTIAEVIYLKGHPKITKEKSDKIIAFFRNEYIIPVVLDRDIAEMARELLWDYQALKPKDASHVASALKASVLMFSTFDEYLIGLSGQIGNPPLIIGEPDIPSQEIIKYE